MFCSNVCFKKTGTKYSSVLLLRFVTVFLKQTLYWRNINKRQVRKLKWCYLNFSYTSATNFLPFVTFHQETFRTEIFNVISMRLFIYLSKLLATRKVNDMYHLCKYIMIMLNLLHSMYAHYGTTGCRVFKGEIQN